MLDEGIASRARIGLVVLASDHTVEYEFRQVVTMPGVAIYQTRIPNSPEITTDSLRDMETDIADQAAVILPGVELDVLAYGCTSASIVLGEDRVFELINKGRPEAQPTTPVTAAFAAFRALQSRRIGVAKSCSKCRKPFVSVLLINWFDINRDESIRSVPTSTSIDFSWVSSET